jgi:hypothetical protein
MATPTAPTKGHTKQPQPTLPCGSAAQVAAFVWFKGR